MSMYQQWFEGPEYASYWQHDSTEADKVFKDLHQKKIPITIMTPLGNYSSTIQMINYDCIILDNPNNELLRDVEHPWRCYVDDGNCKLAFEGYVANVKDEQLYFEYSPKIFKMYRRHATRVPIYGTHAMKLTIDHHVLSIHNLSLGGCGAQIKDNDFFEKGKAYKGVISGKGVEQAIEIDLHCKHINFVQRTESQKYYTLGFYFDVLTSDNEEKLAAILALLSKNNK